MAQTSDEAALALATEQLIYDVVTPLEASDRIGRAKVLLTRHLSRTELPESQIVLQPIASDSDWHLGLMQRKVTVRVSSCESSWLYDCFVLHWCQSTQPNLSATSVICPLDPGHDRDS